MSETGGVFDRLPLRLLGPFQGRQPAPRFDLNQGESGAFDRAVELGLLPLPSELPFQDDQVPYFFRETECPPLAPSGFAADHDGLSAFDYAVALYGAPGLWHSMTTRRRQQVLSDQYRDLSILPQFRANLPKPEPRVARMASEQVTPSALTGGGLLSLRERWPLLAGGLLLVSGLIVTFAF